MKNEIIRFFGTYWYLLPLALLAISLIRYLALAGSAYWLCYKVRTKQLHRYKIQSRTPERKQIRFEIRNSLTTAAIFTLTMIAAGLLYRSGYTRIYSDPVKYGKGYLFISFIWLIVLHDTYFYWTHRLLHTKWLLKHIHSVHHRSVNPTPWAAYVSFHHDASGICRFAFPLYIPDRIYECDGTPRL
jgi:lathosterol oxidase